jgi:hyperosmotically inducible protein
VGAPGRGPADGIAGAAERKEEPTVESSTTRTEAVDHKEEDMKKSQWITGVTLALLATAPVAGQAQTATEKASSKTAQATEKAKGTMDKATGATKDSWITAKTKIALYADDRVPGTDINVDTKNGTVALRGKVATADQKRAAEEVTRSVDGVTAVRNDLQVVPASERKAVTAEDKDLKSAVQTRIKGDTRLKGSDIDVRVDAGVVTLTGDVKDVGARARASEVARSVPGVRSVKNELQEKG